MTESPRPLLGNITALTIATPDPEKSSAYYQALGFSEVLRADWPFPWIQISDGVLLIMLRRSPRPYIDLSYYVSDMESVVGELQSKGIQFLQTPKKTDLVKRHIILSPDGLNISLINMVDGYEQPAGPGMLAMPQEDYFNPEKYVNKTCGLFGELAHPVADLEKSIEFWALLGFKVVSRVADPYPWAIISDGLSIVGLHQTDHFSYPAITFFAADMPVKINRLKAMGLTGYVEKSPGNIVITTPDQQHIFLLSLGMPAESVKKKPRAHNNDEVVPVKEERESKRAVTTPAAADPIPSPTPAASATEPSNKYDQHIIETDRLWLKELSPEVMDKLFATGSDVEIMNNLGLTTIDELAKEKENFRHGLTTYRLSFKNFLMVEKATGRAIGKCGFHTWYLQHKRAELGYAMTAEDTKGKGYMTEAIKALLKYGFNSMDLNRVEAFVGRNNEASLKLMKNFGFTEEGTLRSHYFKNGVMEDSICFSLLRSEYLTQ